MRPTEGARPLASARGPKHLAALAWAAADYYVTPLHGVNDRGCTCNKKAKCEKPGKHPRMRGWQRWASRDPRQIDAWWSKWPDANIGLITGIVFVVLDVDPRNGGEKTLARLVDTFGELPATLHVVTGGRGRHYYFNRGHYPMLRSYVVGPGVELKADGSQVVTVGSVHSSGQEYRFAPGSDHAQVPALMPDWLTTPREARRVGYAGSHDPGRLPAAASTPVPVDPDSTFVEILTSAMAGVPKGQQNDVMFRILCSLRGRGTPERVALELMLALRNRSEPPWQVAKIQSNLRWVYDHYLVNPGQVMIKRKGRPSDLISDIFEVMVMNDGPMTPTEVYRAIALRQPSSRHRARTGRAMPTPNPKNVGQALRRGVRQGIFHHLTGGRYQLVRPPALEPLR